MAITAEEKVAILEKENTELKKRIEELSTNEQGYIVSKETFDALHSDYEMVVEELKKYREKYHQLVEDMNKVKDMYFEKIKDIYKEFGKAN